MLLSNRTYDILKHIAIYVIPSVATFVGVVGVALAWEPTAVVETIISATGALIAGCIGMSCRAYEEALKHKHEGVDDADQS